MAAEDLTTEELNPWEDWIEAVGLVRAATHYQLSHA